MAHDAARGQRVRRLAVLLAALMGTAATTSLGVWQLGRAAEKTALQAAIDGRASMPPLAAGELAATEQAAEGQHYRHIRMRGRWMPQATVFLDNRQMHGRTGFFVVTPLLLEDGSAVVVQRGWVARDFEVRERLPVVPTPDAVVEIDARVAPPPSRLFEFGGAAAASSPIRQNLDLDRYGREWRLRLRPLSLQQLGPGAADGLQRDWLQPAIDVHKHYGYAFQWFAMATLITGLYVWFQVLRPRRTAVPR